MPTSWCCRCSAHGRVFYHGAYKPPREFNWVIGVMLLQFTLLLSAPGTCSVGPGSPCDRSRWART
ncbi:MAG: cytochrome b N-terminal domain-containing protein [Acidimicrobiales bacterium]